MSSLSTYRHVATASHRSVTAPSSVHTAVTINNPKIPISLAKRLLFPQFPAGAGLPSLLVNEDSQLNAQLYDFLALALRGFVMPWWARLSKYDKEFLPEITRIIAVFLRSIEARLALVDLPTLLLKEIPAIITQHYSDYKNTRHKLGSSYATGGTSTLPQLFHQLQPHMAVSVDGQWNETYMRQIVEHVMKTTLPPQDWEAEAERTIVREIIVKNILGSVFNRLAQPWFVHKLLIDLLDSLSLPRKRASLFSLTLLSYTYILFPIQTRDLTMPIIPNRHFSLQRFVVIFLSAVQTISGLCLIVIALTQKFIHTIRHINASTKAANSNPRYINLSHSSLQMLAEILTMRNRISSSILLSFSELYLAFFHKFLDRAIPFLLLNYILTSSRLTKIIIQSKAVLFPNGYPGPPPVEPSLEEQVLLKEQLEFKLSNILPAPLSALVLGPDEETRQQTIHNIIDPLSSRECNVHLLVFLLDAIIVGVFPELGMVPVTTTNYTDVNEEDTL